MACASGERELHALRRTRKSMGRTRPPQSDCVLSHCLQRRRTAHGRLRRSLPIGRLRDAGRRLGGEKVPPVWRLATSIFAVSPTSSSKLCCNHSPTCSERIGLALSLVAKAFKCCWSRNERVSIAPLGVGFACAFWDPNRVKQKLQENALCKIALFSS